MAIEIVLPHDPPDYLQNGETANGGTPGNESAGNANRPHVHLQENIEAVKGAVETMSALDWKESVKEFYDPTPGLPADTVGDRYIATASANGWTIHFIYTGNGSGFDEDSDINNGAATKNEDDGLFWLFDGAAWGDFGAAVVHDALSGLTANNHHNESHNAASHSDIAKTGAQIDAAVDASHAQSHDAASHTDIAKSGAQIDGAVDHAAVVTGNPHVLDATDVGAEPAGAIATHTGDADAHHDNSYDPTSDQNDAMDNANSPDAANPFATMDDVGGTVFGTRQGLITGVIYQAATDGLVMVAITSNGGDSDLEVDTVTPPVVVAAQNNGANTGATSERSVLTWAVKKDEYWRVVLGSGSVSVTWMPIGT